MVRDWLEEGVDPDAEYDDLTCEQCGEPLQQMTGEERTENTIFRLRQVVFDRVKSTYGGPARSVV